MTLKTIEHWSCCIPGLVCSIGLGRCSWAPGLEPNLENHSSAILWLLVMCVLFVCP
jgi:membrane protein YdbS with pleckstrin-like domain